MTNHIILYFIPIGIIGALVLAILEYKGIIK